MMCFHYPVVYLAVICDLLQHLVDTEDILLQSCPGAYADMWRDGVFPKDPDLKEFVISGPASLAALQIQNAFDAKNSKEDCDRGWSAVAA